MSTKLKVECYAGYKGNQRPLALSLGKRRMRITKIIDQWYGPDHTYFKVLTDEENVYILRYREVSDNWELVFFSEGHYQGEVSPGMWKGASS
jgi:hypothetical protein